MATPTTSIISCPDSDRSIQINRPCFPTPGHGGGNCARISFPEAPLAAASISRDCASASYQVSHRPTVPPKARRSTFHPLRHSEPVRARDIYLYLPELEFQSRSKWWDGPCARRSTRGLLWQQVIDEEETQNSKAGCHGLPPLLLVARCYNNGVRRLERPNREPRTNPGRLIALSPRTSGGLWRGSKPQTPFN